MIRMPLWRPLLLRFRQSADFLEPGYEFSEDVF